MTDVIAQLKRLRAGLQKLDEDVRAASPRCPRCGRPTGGIVQGGMTKAQAGLCSCPEGKEES